MTKIIAHRGSSGTHPENTMEAFDEAEKVGVDGIELDVQLSKDGFIVVIHDETVNRTTNGKGWIKDLTYCQLKKLDASNKFKKLFSVSRIPSLEEVCKWALKNQLIINVELKNGLINYSELEEKVIQLIRKYQLENRVILSSFNHYSLVKCSKLAPEIETAPIFMEGLYEPWDYAKRLGASSIHPYHPVATREMIEQSHDHGIAVRAFTVNKVKLMEELAKHNCDAIITDYPMKAVSNLK